MKLRNMLDLPLGDSIEIAPLAEYRHEWLTFLETVEMADICHHPAWADIFAETFGLDSLLIFHRTGGKIDGGLPLVIFDQPLTGKALISMPYLNYGGIVTTSPAVEHKLVETSRKIMAASQADYMELRHVGRGLEDMADNSRRDRMTFRLALEKPADEIFSSLKKQLRTRLRKAENFDLSYYRGLERLDDFYGLFAQAMKEHGTPVMPKRFFAAVLKHLPENAETMIAYQGGIPLGGKFFLKFKDRVTMTWGCFPMKHKRLLANYYLTWELIKQLAEGPYRVLDFGRSAPDSGGHDYKSNWKPDEIPLFTDYIASDPGKIPHLKPDNTKFKIAIATWKKMPLGLTKLIGPHLARYFT